MSTKWTTWIGGALLAAGVNVQMSVAAPGAVQSQSGQFLVHEHTPSSANPVASVLATNKEFLELEPALLVVSCERIRQAVTRELGLTGQWQGRIQINLFPVGGVADPITITADQFRGEWNYRVMIPDVVERRRFMRAILEVLLVEVANRSSNGKSAELPPWLAVGFAEHLLASSEAELLFPPPRTKAGGLLVSRTVVTERRRDPLGEARTQLSRQAPLTLQELSWPTEQDFSGDSAGTYRASAHLFVAELLQLNNGPTCLRSLLQELPRHLNWQTAFFKAFHAHFARPLDAEKWWALQTAYFTGRDPAHLWSEAESWRKLKEAIQVPAQVRPSPKELPAAGTIPLQTVIGKWDVTRQTAVLRDRIRQLELVRQRVSADLAPLAENYRVLLANYLDRRDKIGTVPGRRRFARSDMERLIEETIRGLSELDGRLESHQTDLGNPPAAPEKRATTAAR